MPHLLRALRLKGKINKNLGGKSMIAKANCIKKITPSIKMHD
jgi:hypothetical protein